MTKNIVAATHTFHDHGSGIFRTGAPVVSGDRPHILLTGNNPHTAALNANYASSTLRSTTLSEVGGANQYAYRLYDIALGYAIENDAAVGQYAVDEVEAIVANHESAFAPFIAGDIAPIRANAQVFAYDRGLYAHQTIKSIALTFDWCYDLLTPTQRTRWMDVCMQIMYAILNPYDARIHNNGNSVDWEDTPGGNNPYTWAWDTVSSNYHHHHIAGLAVAALAFKDMPAITYTMQSGNVSLDSDYWLNELTTVQLPRMAVLFDQMLGGGSIEGTNYGKAIHDLYYARAMMRWSTGVDHFAPIATYLESTVMWRAFLTMPDLYGSNDTPLSLSHGRNATEPTAVITRDEVYSYAEALAGNESHPFAGELKKMISQHQYYPSGGIWARMQGLGFIMRPVYDAITEAATYDNMPKVWAASHAGDNILRTGFDADDISVSLRSGELHSGNHAHDDATSVTLWKNGFLIGTGQQNRSPQDHYLGGTSVAFDSEDRANVSLVGVGNNTAAWYTADSNVYFTYLPDTLYVEDNSGSDGDLYASVEGAPTYGIGSNVTKQQRDVVLIDGVLLVFDRIECTNAENVILQWNTYHDSTINGDTFSWGNGNANAELTLLTHTANWTKTDRATTVRLGTGLYAHRSDLGSATSHSVLSAINIDGAATSIVLGSPVVGETTAIITYVGGATKTVTFYDAQQRRSVS